MAKYEEWLSKQGLLKIEGWASDGLTDEQIAHNMGINIRTLYRWKNEHCQLCHALKKGKEVVDRQVENALLKRALGYDYVEIKEEIENGVVTKCIRTTRHVVPDTTAQIFWLKNRKPDVWRDKQNLQVEGSLNTASSLTDEELEDRISRLRSKLGVNTGK